VNWGYVILNQIFLSGRFLTPSLPVFVVVHANGATPIGNPRGAAGHPLPRGEGMAGEDAADSVNHFFSACERAQHELVNRI
jgi:hypothetical protein